MINIEILSPLMFHLSRTEEGLTAWQLSKKMGISEQKTKYHLEKCVEDGLVKSEGNGKTIYKLINKVVKINGATVHLSDDGILLIQGCKYYLQGCNCVGVAEDECKMLKEITKELKNIVKKVNLPTQKKFR